MSLALSETVIDGLQNLGNSISLELSKKLITNSIKLMINPKATVPPAPEIYATNADKAKQSEYAVVAVISLAIKHCCDSLKLRQLLEEQKTDAAIVDELLRAYEDNHKDLVLRQMQLGNSFPHITDIQWRIVCDVKSSTSDHSSGEVGFQVNLGRYDQESGERITIVEFLCNTEELQSLINKLKEIERHCEKVANN